MSEIKSEDFISEMEKAEAAPKRRKSAPPVADTNSALSESLEMEATSPSEAAPSTDGPDPLDVLFPEPPTISLKEGLTGVLKEIHRRIEAHNLTGKSDGLDGSSIHGTRVMSRFRCLELEIQNFIDFAEKEGIH